MGSMLHNQTFENQRNLWKFGNITIMIYEKCESREMSFSFRGRLPYSLIDLWLISFLMKYYHSELLNKMKRSWVFPKQLEVADKITGTMLTITLKNSN